MATTAERHTESERRFLLTSIGWSGYETMLALIGERPIRLTYDRGNLELMSPSPEHELPKRLLGILVQALVEELDIPCVGAGSTTWRREDLDRGLEPDECFYLYEHAETFPGKSVDLSVDPPPDLAIEIENTRSTLDRRGIYAALRVPELWCYDGQTLLVLKLRADQTYEPTDQSPSFPFLPLEEVARLLKLGETMDHSRWGRMVRDWIKRELRPGN